MGRLDEVDLDHKLSGREGEKQLEGCQRRLLELRLSLGGLTGDGRLGPPVCVLFEGWDASGKGGAIKRLVAPLDPRHVRVVQFGVPSDEERRHHFLWRFWPSLPGRGGMTVLDRSWYGRVLVERVDELTAPEHWSRAYGEINAFERTLTDEGMVLVKFWLHISSAEQLKRFESRRDDPLKSWKLTDEDWKNREKRPQYTEAVEEMFEHTDQPNAPWHVVSAESKPYARVAVLKKTIERIEDGMRADGFEPPPPLSG